MTDILDNELVRKYFHVGCNETLCYLPHKHDAMRAVLVLRAMQEPIRKGERYLEYIGSGVPWIEKTLAENEFYGPFHAFTLRLPDRFQTAGKKECQSCVTYKIHVCEDHPSPWRNGVERGL